MGFGEKLRRERELRGVTLEEIAQSTKIGTRSLRALEEDDLDKLPGGIFNKGFVRAYAKYLGIDEEQAVTDFLQIAQESQKPAPIAPAIAEEMERTSPQAAAFPWRALVLIVVLAAGGWAGWRAYSSGAVAHLRARVPHAKVAFRPQQDVIQPPHAPAASTNPDAVAPGSAGVAATGSSAAAPAQAIAAKAPGTAPASGVIPAAEVRSAAPQSARDDTQTQPLLLEVRAREDAWISVSTDGKTVFEGTLPANRDKSFRAGSQIVFKTGNAGAVQLSYNGKVLPNLGNEKQVRSVTLTAEGVQP